MICNNCKRVVGRNLLSREGICKNAIACKEASGNRDSETSSDTSSEFNFRKINPKDLRRLDSKNST